MLDKQNQGPQCAACGSPMRLAVIEPSMWSQHLRTFACPRCNSSEVHFVESSVTEASLEPKSHQRT
jgi:transposase-like protein